MGIGSRLSAALDPREYPRLLRRAAATLGVSPRRPLADIGESVAEPWMVDAIEIADACVAVRGWSIPDEATPPIDRREFRLNGRTFERIAYPLLRPDVGKLFWQRRNAELCGFECTSGLSSDAYRDGVLEIERVRPSASALDRGRDSWFVPDPSLHTDLPDADRRYRVIGNRDAVGFLQTGATDYHRLDRAILGLTGRRLHEFDHILDWGSGCGRVARHFPKPRAGALTGCDIDHGNVRWCTEHLPGRFVDSNIVPPLPFDDGEFDVVYGISVFTHLREPLQFEWLQELARITRSNGYLLLTVHGTTALEFAPMAPSEVAHTQRAIAQKGLLVGGANSQIDGHADHKGEYVNVFHSHDYVRRTWSRYFDVVAILPGYIFTHDLVVLRKPAVAARGRG